MQELKREKQRRNRTVDMTHGIFDKFNTGRLLPQSSRVYRGNRPEYTNCTKAYMAGIWDAVREGKPGISGIIDENDLKRNLEEACIPEGFSGMTFEDYDRFLEAHRILMVKKIRAYYESLK